MATNILLPGRAVTFTVAASDKIASYSTSRYTIDKTVGYPNVPDTVASVFANSGANTTTAFAAATTVTIAAGDAAVLYETGTAPVIYDRANYQPTPGTLNATGTLTAALILGGIVTSTTGAGVTATLDTGAAMDIAIDIDVDEAFDWSAIATGANSFVVTASAGHTLVGVGTVATVTSGSFRTRKTAADTFVTYRLA